MRYAAFSLVALFLLATGASETQAQQPGGPALGLPEHVYRVEDVPAPYATYTEIETAAILEAALPSLQQATRLKPYRERERLTVWSDGSILPDRHGLHADADFFEVFALNLLAGDASALAQPHAVVLSRTLADELFESHAEALGQRFTVDAAGRSDTLEVGGVVEDAPDAWPFAFDFLVSFATMRAAMSELDFMAKEVWTYTRLREGATPTSLEQALQEAAHQIHVRPSYRLRLVR